MNGSESPTGNTSTPLPSMGGSLAVVSITVVLGLVGFVTFLQREQPGPGWLCLAVLLVVVSIEERSLPGLRERRKLRIARKHAQFLLAEVRKALKKQKGWTGSGNREELEAKARTLETVLQTGKTDAIEAATIDLDKTASQVLVRKSATRATIEQVGSGLLLVLLVRAFFYESFKIPSSSMVPTLFIGDRLFVNKFIYGLRIPFTLTKIGTKLPQRGDIVVFNRPGDESGDDIIKRVIGLPGDVVEVRDRHITLNGVPLETRQLPIVRLNNDGDSATRTHEGPFLSFQPFEETIGTHHHVALEIVGRPQLPPTEGRWVVEPDHVFLMGDNRDNSMDSRFGPEIGGFGQVPVNYIKGRADIIWLSVGGPQGVRFDRTFQPLR